MMLPGSLNSDPGGFLAPSPEPDVRDRQLSWSFFGSSITRFRLTSGRPAGSDPADDQGLTRPLVGRRIPPWPAARSRPERRRRRSPPAPADELAASRARSLLGLPLAIGLSLPRSLRRKFLLDKKPSLFSHKDLRDIRLLSTNPASRRRRRTPPRIAKRMTAKLIAVQQHLSSPPLTLPIAAMQRRYGLGAHTIMKQIETLMRRVQNARIVPGQLP